MSQVTRKQWMDQALPECQALRDLCKHVLAVAGQDLAEGRGREAEQALLAVLAAGDYICGNPSRTSLLLTLGRKMKQMALEELVILYAKTQDSDKLRTTKNALQELNDSPSTVTGKRPTAKGSEID